MGACIISGLMLVVQRVRVVSTSYLVVICIQVSVACMQGGMVRTRVLGHVVGPDVVWSVFI